MKRCFCEGWMDQEDMAEEFQLGYMYNDFEGAYFRHLNAKFCPWCGKPLAESQSQQKRLKVQLGQKNA